jgi:chromosome segregation ATPase
MFDDLRTAFREALDNFNKELKRDQVPETVDRLLVGMRSQLTDETAEVRGLEAELEKAVAASAREKDAGETCRRREKMARDIADEDTAALAGQHAAKHEGHHAVLERKAQAIREELDFRRKTVAEMSAQLAEAMQKRGTLGASAGRTDARQALSDADDLFSELDRMAEKMTGERAQTEAIDEVDSLDLGGDEASDYEVTLDAPPPREEMDVDAALAELKRRMGRE